MKKMVSNIRLTHRDPFLVGLSTAFGLTLSALVNGVVLARAANVLSALEKPAADPSVRGPSIPSNWAESYGMLQDIPVDWLGCSAESNGNSFVPPSSFHGAVSQSRDATMLANNPQVTIEPASAVCQVFGLSCTASFLLPAAYYLAARFKRDFEMAVLSAINGGGHNMARAALTGALSGAQVGLSGIPERFITGLTDHERLIGLAERVAKAAGGD